MCKISSKLKLCTCKTQNAERLKHYWILKRHNGKNECIIGVTILPANIGKDADRVNEKTLHTLLNSGNCFDVELQHQENDILELHFTLYPDTEKQMEAPCHGNYLAYAFVFKKGKWKKNNYDPFGENLSDIQKGKIKKPFAFNH